MSPSRILTLSLLFVAACLSASPGFAISIRHPDGDAPPEILEEFGAAAARVGDTLLVGVPKAAVGVHADAGAVDFYAREGTGWRRTRRLAAAAPAANAGFGGSLAVDGALVAIGTPSAWRNPAGRVEIVAVEAGEPRFVETIDAPAGEVAFGRAVAMSSDRLAIASSANGEARVHVYERSQGRYQRVSTLTSALDPTGFGAAVAFDQDALLVGAIHTPRGNHSGVIAVYRRAESGWTAQGQFMPTDAAALGPTPHFGGRIATSGGTVLVSAIDPLAPDSDELGAAFVFVRNGAAYAQQRNPLTAGTRDRERGFGFGLALDGDVAVVGAPFGTDGNRDGRAHTYLRIGDRWNLRGIVTSDAGGISGAGTAVAIVGDDVVVTLPQQSSLLGTPAVGALETWRRDRAVDLWARIDSHVRSDGPLQDQFGARIAVSGNTALVAAPFQGRGRAEGAGRVHVYRRRQAGWAYEAELVGSDAPETNGWFGFSIALAGDVAVVGAMQENAAESDAGRAYVFRRGANAAWVREAVLVAPNGRALDNFGTSVAIDRDTKDRIVVGAWQGDSAARNAGSAYTFRRNGNAWEYEMTLLASDPQTSDSFGFSVALEGGRAFVGAPRDDVDAIRDAGSVRVFQLDAGGNEAGLLKPGPTVVETLFGHALATARDGAATRLYVGAPGADSVVGALTGAVYRIDWNGQSVPASVKLATPAGVASRDSYGEALATHGGELLVGAPLTDREGVVNRGAAYHFDRDDLLGVRLDALGGEGDTRNFGRAVALGLPVDAMRHEPWVGLEMQSFVPELLTVGRVDVFAPQPLLSDGFEDAAAVNVQRQ